jgi:hypothetical protein
VNEFQIIHQQHAVTLFVIVSCYCNHFVNGEKSLIGRGFAGPNEVETLVQPSQPDSGEQATRRSSEEK